MPKDYLRSLAERKGYQFQSYGDIHMLVVPFEDGRSQVVSATVPDEGDEEERCLLYSTVGEPGPHLDLEELLRVQMAWTHARLGILSGDLVVCVALELAAMGSETGSLVIEEAIEEIAFVGDRLEDDLFGVDAS